MNTEQDKNASAENELEKDLENQDSEVAGKAFGDIEREATTGGGNANAEPTIEDLQNELAEKSNQLLRAAAEVENVRKRGRRDAEEARKYAPAQLLNDLLTVVDDLKRAVESAEQNEHGSGLIEGVRMVTEQFESVLEKHHCRKIEALGKPFDPNLHEAIQMQPSNDFAANHVSLEARVGYQFHDRVLRTSQVFVSTGPANSAS